MGGNQRLSMNIAAELKGLLGGGGAGGRGGGHGGSVIGRGGEPNKALTKFAQTAAQDPNSPVIVANNGEDSSGGNGGSRTLVDGTIAAASLVVAPGMQTLQKKKSKGMMAEMNNKLGIKAFGAAPAAATATSNRAGADIGKDEIETPVGEASDGSGSSGGAGGSGGNVSAAPARID